MTKEEIQRVLDLSLEYYKSEVFGTEKESEKPSSERIDWTYDKMKGSSEIPKDLEEAAIQYAMHKKKSEEKEMETELPMGAYFLAMDSFIAGAKWMKEQMLKDGLDAVKTCDFNKVEKTIAGVFVDYGMRRQKEQLMKETVEGYIERDCGGQLILGRENSPAGDEFMLLDGFLFPEIRAGEKYRVRIIIVKEDEK